MGSLKDLSGLDWVQESDILDRLYDSPYMSFQGGTIDDVLDANDPLIQPTFEHSLINLASGYHGVYRGQLQTPRAQVQEFKKREQQEKKEFNAAYERSILKTIVDTCEYTYNRFVLYYYKRYTPNELNSIQTRVFRRHLEAGHELLLSISIEDNNTDKFYKFSLSRKREISNKLGVIMSNAHVAAKDSQEIEFEKSLIMTENRERRLQRIREKSSKEKAAELRAWKERFENRKKERERRAQERAEREAERQQLLEKLRQEEERNNLVLQQEYEALEKEVKTEIERIGKNDFALDIATDLENRNMTICDWYQEQLEEIRVRNKGKPYKFDNLMTKIPIEIVHIWMQSIFHAIIESRVLGDVLKPYEELDDALKHRTLSVDAFYRKLCEMIYGFNQLSLSLQWVPSSMYPFFSVSEQLDSQSEYSRIYKVVDKAADLFVDLYNHNILQNMHKMDIYPIENPLMRPVLRGHKAFGHLDRGPDGIDYSHWSW